MKEKFMLNNSRMYHKSDEDLCQVLLLELINELEKEMEFKLHEELNVEMFEPTYLRLWSTLDQQLFKEML